MKEVERQAALAQYRRNRQGAVLIALSATVSIVQFTAFDADTFMEALERQGWAVLSIGVYEPSDDPVNDASVDITPVQFDHDDHGSQAKD